MTTPSLAPSAQPLSDIVETAKNALLKKIQIVSSVEVHSANLMADPNRKGGHIDLSHDDGSNIGGGMILGVSAIKRRFPAFIESLASDLLSLTDVAGKVVIAEKINSIGKTLEQDMQLAFDSEPTHYELSMTRAMLREVATGMGLKIQQPAINAGAAR